MGKGKRTKADRRAPTRRRIVVVDRLEVGAVHGMLTLRVNGHRAPAVPTSLAIPADMAEDVLRGLQLAVLDAEEEYWKLIGPLVSQVADPTDQEAVAKHVETWVLDQDWDGALAAAPDDEGPLLLTHAGHVALAIDPPFVTQSTLVVFDPQQLHRTRSSFQTAFVQAQQTPVTAPWSLTQSAADVHRFLATKPWPPTGFPTVTPDQADTEMRRRWTEHLKRSPFIRPESNDLRNAIQDPATDLRAP
jgi:hypothetical protein